MFHAVFRLERATEVLKLTYLDKYFACVNANCTLVNTVQDNKKLTKVKVRFTLRAGMVKVGNQLWMTDTSACGRTEFHILWCRDCVSLIRSRFRDQVFDQVSTFGFGLRRSYGKKQRHKSLRMRPTRKVKLTPLYR